MYIYLFIYDVCIQIMRYIRPFNYNYLYFTTIKHKTIIMQQVCECNNSRNKYVILQQKHLTNDTIKTSK